MIKLVAVDMDGTFLDNHQDYDRKRFAALYPKLKVRGIVFCVASGNQVFQLQRFFPGIENDLSYVAENGAMVVHQGEILDLRIIPDTALKRIYEELRRHPSLHAIVCTPTMAYMLKDDPHWEIAHRYYARLKEVESFAHIDEPILKFNLNFPSDVTQEIIDRFTLALHQQAKVVSSGHGNLDIIASTCSKATGLETLCHRLNLSPSEVLSFGDGGNDIEMLHWSGHSFAMANASDHIQAQAQGVCFSNQDQGVLIVLERLCADKEVFVPYFTSPRCVVRPFQDADILSFLTYRCDPAVARYQGWKDYNCAKALAFVDWAKSRTLQNDSLQMAIELTSTGEHIGDVYLAFEDDATQVGYTLSTDHQHQGYMTEVLNSLIPWVKALKHKPIQAELDPLNAASEQLLKRCGFKEISRKPDSLLYHHD